MVNWHKRSRERIMINWGGQNRWAVAELDDLDISRIPGSSWGVEWKAAGVALRMALLDVPRLDFATKTFVFLERVFTSFLERDRGVVRSHVFFQ